MAWTSGIHGLSSAAFMSMSHHASTSAQFDGLMLFGVISAVATAGCYLHRHDGPIAMMTFAASLAASGAYGFAEGAWPLGMLETAWAIGAARRGLRSKASGWKRRSPGALFLPDLESRQSRYGPTLGSN
jgi:hypothetical protein